jgi:hypothetical protein
MIVIKKVDNYLNVIVATLLNIEHGVVKYSAIDDDIIELPPDPTGNYKPMLTIDLPQRLSYAKPLKVKVNTRYGFIFCLLDKMSLEKFVKKLKAKISQFSTDHLKRNITGISHSTLTIQDAVEGSLPRRFIISEHLLKDSVLSGFTWYVSGLTSNAYSPHVYSKMSQMIPMISSVLYDEMDVFSYNHNDIIYKSSASKMKIPQLPKPLQAMSESLMNDQIGILINHDLYEIEFISQFSALLCTRLPSLTIPHTKGPYRIPKWRTVKKTLAFQTSCEYDCFICRFPVCVNGYIVTALVPLDDEYAFHDDYAEIYCTYIDPIVNNFSESDKCILMCEHCIRIILYLSKMRLDLICYQINIPVNYKKLVHMSPTTKMYASLLDSIEMGRESRVIKANYRDSQFYVIDRNEIKDVFIKDPIVRHSNMPVMPVTMFWFNSSAGYR